VVSMRSISDRSVGGRGISEDMVGLLVGCLELELRVRFRRDVEGREVWFSCVLFIVDFYMVT
jgi:hypothetical protein